MRKYIVFLIYVVIICCLVFITTGTYTLMTLEDEVVINNTEVKIQLLEARYIDTSNISIVNSKVGDTLTKVFYIKNLTDKDLYYNINLVDVANSFVNKDELVFSLESDDAAYINNKIVPSSNSTLASSIKIDANQEHKYVLNIEFLNTGKNQFENEFKTFFAKLNVVTSEQDFESYSEKSLYKIVENSSYGNEKVGSNNNDISGGVFSTNSTTNGGTVYYYKGSKNLNNNIILGNMCFKLIRTTESFDVKAIYNGEVVNGQCNGTNVLVEKSHQFNKNSNYNAYVGYMYGSPSSNEYINEHSNMSSSSVKIILDSWFNTKLEMYDDYISNNGVYCSNRKTSDFNYYKIDFDNKGYGNSVSGYIMMDKYINNKINLVCENEIDRFSVLEGYGNGELSHSVGLISLDELYYSGYFDSPSNNYLQLKEPYWTMSPAYFYAGNAYNFVVSNNKVVPFNVSGESGLRPVVTFKGTSEVLDGNGSVDSPYVLYQ